MNGRIYSTVCGLVLTLAAFSSSGCVPVAGASEGKPFGIEKFTLQTTHTREVAELNGINFINEPYTFTQAGGHPWALTSTIEFTSEQVGERVVPTRDPKDVVVDLPPGLLGNPQAMPRCPLTQVINKGIACPAETQVGVARVSFVNSRGKEALGPIVNVTPEAGQSAEFAVESSEGFRPVLTAHLVRTAQGYGITVASNDIPMSELTEAELTFWGVPADPSHDPMRGLKCLRPSRKFPLCDLDNTGDQHVGAAPVPFLTMPTSCTAGSGAATIRADSWEEPGRIRENQRYEGYVEESVEAPLPTVVPPAAQTGFTGCEQLQFDAGTGIGVKPETELADEPVGLEVSLKVPQNEKPETDAKPQLRDTTVTLPEGVSVSSGIVDGVRACDESGPEGIDITGPESEEVGLNGELQLAPGHCPNASTVGTAEVITPLLPVPVKGHIYLARPGCGGPAQNPCTEQDALDGNLYKLYLELGGQGEFANSGIEFKVPGYVEANPATGQLTTKFEGLVQAPYSEVKIHLNGGPRASLDNPAACGPASTTADFTPWSAPGTIDAGPEKGFLVAGTPDLTSSSSFGVVGCASPQPFAPGFVAGTVNPNAGQFSAFTLNLSRSDREQYVKGIQIHTPPGLLAMISSVQPCSEAQADNPSLYGECAPASKIGTTRVATGAGSHPFEIEGSIYLTGPYEGAPFGLSVVTHAVAGPFNLGLVVVRARLNIDPETSTATVTTDEAGPYALPQIIFGVPLRLQRVTVDVNRPGFMFNPTNCGAQQISARISGSGDAVADVASPFAAGGCRGLAFKPKFTVSTNGHTSRANGASLDAKLTYPPGSMGNEANIARAKVSLPRQLPSRLTTLQKACTAATFAANPAACPKAAVVGIVRTRTPVLPVELEGPVYFVSHGGQAFPSLIAVLQGDGVRVDLTGATFISKAGITSSTFKTVPDVPVDSFELYLPQGKFSALAANGNLCKSAAKLKMPTEFVAQNGAVVKQSTKIAVTGCGKPAKTRRR